MDLWLLSHSITNVRWLVICHCYDCAVYILVHRVSRRTECTTVLKYYSIMYSYVPNKFRVYGSRTRPMNKLATPLYYYRVKTYLCINIISKYSLVKINWNAGQQNAILPSCSLFTSYSCTVGTQYFIRAPFAPSKLFNCFTIAVYCRCKVVTVNFH